MTSAVYSSPWSHLIFLNKCWMIFYNSEMRPPDGSSMRKNSKELCQCMFVAVYEDEALPQFLRISFQLLFWQFCEFCFCANFIYWSPMLKRAAVVSFPAFSRQLPQFHGKECCSLPATDLRSGAEFLALKHESRILRQSSILCIWFLHDGTC